MANPFSRVRTAAIDGRVHNPIYRKTQLKKLHDALAGSAAEIRKAIAQDTGHRPAEITVEYWLALRCLADSYASIDPEALLAAEYAVATSRDTPDAREPVGIVVIEPAAHTFLFSLISALAPAIAAGNCVVVQVDQTMLKTPRLVLGLVDNALDGDIFHHTSKRVTDADIDYRHVRVLQNGAPEPLLANHIASRPEARVVAVVERDADLQAAAEALVGARFGLRGRSPYAPDVVLVNEWVKKDLLGAVVQCSIRLMANAGEASEPEARVAKAFVDEIAKEGLARVVSSGSQGMVVDVDNRESVLMKRKIRECCLVVHGVTSMDDAIDLSKGLGHLSAAFVFTTTLPAAKYLCQFLDTDVGFVNQIPASLLFGPAAPVEKHIDPTSATRYDAAVFTLPKPQYVSRPKHSQLLSSILLGASSLQLQTLDDEAVAALPEMKRPAKIGDIGFFNQGILTGAVLFLSTAVACTGALGYYAVKFARPRFQAM